MEADWINGLLGGLLIGLSAAVMLLANGRIAGISGIAGGLLGGLVKVNINAEMLGRILFVIGLIAGPLLVGAVHAPPAIAVTGSTLLLIAGGLLVGFGTRLGSGCTSGHGVCGMSRFSLRSIVATCIFMAAAAITVAIVHHAVGGLS